MGLEEEAKEILNNGLRAAVDRWHELKDQGKAKRKDYLDLSKADSKALKTYNKVIKRIERRG